MRTQEGTKSHPPSHHPPPWGGSGLAGGRLLLAALRATHNNLPSLPCPPRRRIMQSKMRRRKLKGKATSKVHTLFLELGFQARHHPIACIGRAWEQRALNCSSLWETSTDHSTIYFKKTS